MIEVKCIANMNIRVINNVSIVISVENGVTSNYNKDAEGNPLVQLYGADDFLLNSMDVHISFHTVNYIEWEANQMRLPTKR